MKRKDILFLVTIVASLIVIFEFLERRKIIKL